MPLSPYLPHVLYSLALTSLSINLVGRRRTTEDERARVAAQLSILASIKEQLRGEAPLSAAELARLKKLARASAAGGEDGGREEGVREGERIPWGDVFRGKGPGSRGAELSEWDRRDLEIRECCGCCLFFVLWCALLKWGL